MSAGWGWIRHVWPPGARQMPRPAASESNLGRAPGARAQPALGSVIRSECSDPVAVTTRSTSAILVMPITTITALRVTTDQRQTWGLARNPPSSSKLTNSRATTYARNQRNSVPRTAFGGWGRCGIAPCRAIFGSARLAAPTLGDPAKHRRST